MAGDTTRVHCPVRRVPNTVYARDDSGDVYRVERRDEWDPDHPLYVDDLWSGRIELGTESGVVVYEVVDSVAEVAAGDLDEFLAGVHGAEVVED